MRGLRLALVALLVAPALLDVSAQAAPALRRADVHMLWPASHADATSSASQLTYGGGRHGVGVLRSPKVFLVFWGSQWKRTDPYVAYEERLFRGLYGAGDDWTAVSMQYCQGIAVSSLACARNNPHIGRPTHQLLQGVWFDDASAAVPTDIVDEPTNAADTVAQEAVRAAQHFGNATSTTNADVQYIINEPSHYNSVGFPSYCAYHANVTSPMGTLVYTDLPYVLDGGTSCGRNAVNPGSRGTYDGLSIVVGHEFVESLTDPYTGTGWIDGDGQEAADKCAWIAKGQGAMTDLRLRTGVFAMQSTWSDAFNHGVGGCVLHDPRQPGGSGPRIR